MWLPQACKEAQSFNFGQMKLLGAHYVHPLGITGG